MRRVTGGFKQVPRLVLVVWGGMGVLAADPVERPPASEVSPSDGVVTPAAQPQAGSGTRPSVSTSGPRLGARAAIASSRGTQETAFAWDALLKEATLAKGQDTGRFTFHLTNVTASPVTINQVRSSCGCTVVKLPAVPWEIGPSESGEIEVELDGRGKFGVLTKTVTVQSSAGYRYLTVRVSLPARSASPLSLSQRSRNMRLALADRQAVFEKSCAECHVKPGVGKAGRELYEAVCGVCHEAEHRASMVPNLKALQKPQSTDYWRQWITLGKERTLMPAWAKAKGGPLTDEQIESLVTYLSGPFKTADQTARGSAGSDLSN